jgi:diguanylate cyclase (GGDEF)-like protein/PAS domain S-box-containing protein
MTLEFLTFVFITLSLTFTIALLRRRGYEQAAQKKLTALNQELEKRIAERTAALMKTNEQLLQELAERKHAQRALHEREALYLLLTENASDVIWVMDAESGVLRYVSPSVERLLGYTAKEAIRKLPGQYLTRDSLAYLQSVVPDRLTRFRNGHREVFSDEFEQRRQDGRTVWTEVHARYVRNSASGHIEAIGVTRDITQRKREEDILHFLANAGADEPFFNALARYLAKVLDMEFVCIDMLEGDGLNARTIAVLCDGQFEDNLTYALKDTPCGDVVGKSVCLFPKDVCRLFPNDQALKNLKAQSYVGVTLWSHTGAAIGLIAVVGRKPLADRLHAESTLKLVAVRAAGELERQQSENLLRAQENQYRTLINNLPVGIVVHAPDTSILLSNPMASQLLGLSFDQMIGKTAIDPAWSFQHEDGLPLALAEYPVNRVLSTGQPVKGQIVGISRPDLTELTWALCNAYPVRETDGHIVQAVVTFVDITRRKRAEAALKVTMAFSSNLIANMLDGVSVLDDRGAHRDVNRALCQMTGYSREELIGVGPPFPYWPEEQLPTIQAAFDNTLAGAPGTYELMFKRKNGERFPVIVSPFAVKDENDNILSYSATVKDITERKLAEQALIESEERFRSLMENIPNVAVQGYELDGTVSFWNRASEALYGYSAAEAKGSDLRQLIIPEDMWDTVSQAIQIMKQTGKPIPAAELQLRRKDGSTVQVLSSHALVERGSQPPELFCLDIDLTERKRAEAALLDSESRFRRLYESGIIGFFFVNDEDIREANEAFLAIIGYSREELYQGSISWRKLTPAMWAALDDEKVAQLKSFENCPPYEKEFIHKDGRVIPVLIGAALLQKEPFSCVCYVQDITAQKSLQEQLRQQAYTDELTGIINRHRFLELAHAELKRAVRHQRPLSIALIDIDFFKRINDTYGHAAGDQALVTFAANVQKIIREIDLFARYGGDEFVLLLPEMPPSLAGEIMQRICVSVAEQPIDYGSTPFSITISVGIAGLTSAGESLESLLEQADQALYWAKAAGRNRVVAELFAAGEASPGQLTAPDEPEHPQ